MQFATINGTTLHYRTDGDAGDRPLVAFVNSLGTDFRIWDDVVSRLADDFALLRYDMRGHGLSGIGEPPYTIADHAADLAALLAHVGADDVIVCGISAGGQIALSLAARRPQLVRGLVLCDTAHRIGDRTFWNARIAAIEQAGIGSIAGAILGRWFAPSFAAERPAQLAGFRAMLCRQPADGYVGTAIAVRDCDLTDIARRIGCPTLCLVGEHDLSTPPALVRSLAALIPGAGYEIIAGAGHLPCVECPTALAEHIRAFVAGLEMESISHVTE